MRHHSGFRTTWLALWVSLSFLVPAFAETLERLDQQLTAIDSQSTQLRKEYEKEKKANDERIQKAEEARLKDRADTAEGLLRDAYSSAERLTLLNERLNQLRQQREQVCLQWRPVYEKVTDDLLLSAQTQQDRKKKGEIGKKLQGYQARNAQLCAEALKTSFSQDWKSLRIESYDGPAEIREKSQLLRDISREININVAKLDQQYQDFLRERKTKERAQEFIQESTLFTDTLNVRPATRGETTGPDPNGEQVVDMGSSEAGGQSSSPQVMGSSDWPSKESGDQLELQYQKLRNDLLTQQKELQKKLTEFDQRAKALTP